MIVFIQADGTAITVAPSPVYQGSSLSGSLYLVAPFPRTNAASVAFQLADGKYTESYPMTSIAELEGVTDKLGDEYSIWEWQTKNAFVTAKAGTVTAQFTVSYYGEIVATSAVNFTVQKGILPLPPTEPTADQWQTLIDLYGDLAGRVTDLEDAEQRKVLVDFTVNSETGAGIKYYSDGTTANVQFPIGGGGGGETVRTDYLRVLSFTADSFTGNETAGYELAFGAQQTGFDDDRFMVLLERSGKETYEAGTETTPSERTGHYTQSDTVFIGSDGSILLTANEAYAGRLLLLGGSVWSGDWLNHMITDVEYDLTTHILTFTYVNGETKTLQFESKLSQFENDEGFATEEYVDTADTALQNAITTLQDDSAANIALTVNPNTYVIEAQLKNAAGDAIGDKQTIDLPLESVVVGGEYDEASKSLVLTLKNGNTVDIPIGELVSGLMSKPEGNPSSASVVVVNSDGAVSYATSFLAQRTRTLINSTSWIGSSAPYYCNIIPRNISATSPLIRTFNTQNEEVWFGVVNDNSGTIRLYSNEKISFYLIIF